MFATTIRIGLILVALVLADSRNASAALYLYTDAWNGDTVNPDDTVTLYATATGESDESYAISVTVTIKDPSGAVVAFRSRHGSYSVVSDTSTDISIEGEDGVYEALGTADQPATGLHIGCIVVSIDTQPYRSHYYLSEIGSPNIYLLDSDSTGKKCSHSSFTWNATHFNMTDHGLYFSFGGIVPLACTGICKSGKNGSVIGPNGSVGGQGHCD